MDPAGQHLCVSSIKSGQQIYGQTDSCSEKPGMRLHLPLDESFKTFLTEKLSEQSVLPPRKLLWNIGITVGFTRFWRHMHSSNDPVGTVCLLVFFFFFYA